MRGSDIMNKDKEDPRLKDSADNNGIVPDDALQKSNPAEAERLSNDHDPHHVVKDHKQHDTERTKSTGMAKNVK